MEMSTGELSDGRNDVLPNACISTGGNLLCLWQTPKMMHHVHGNIPCMFDYWTEPVVHLYLLKSSKENHGKVVPKNDWTNIIKAMTLRGSMCPFIDLPVMAICRRQKISPILTNIYLNFDNRWRDQSGGSFHAQTSLHDNDDDKVQPTLRRQLAVVPGQRQRRSIASKTSLQSDTHH